VTASAPASLQDPGAFILGDDALNLQQEVVLGRAAKSAVEEHNLDADTAKLVDEQHLISVAPRQPIGSMNVEALHLTCGHSIAQPLQSWPCERRAAHPLVDVNVLRADLDGIDSGTLLQRGELTGHRVVLHLPVARNPRVQGGYDPSHGQSSCASEVWPELGLGSRR